MKKKLDKIESNGYFGASENTEPEIAFRYCFFFFYLIKAQGQMYVLFIAWDTIVFFQCGQTRAPLLIAGEP